MITLAYCAGLRLGEIVSLTLGDLDLEDGLLEIRDTKFFKSRRLPLASSAINVLSAYLDVRAAAGAPTAPDAPMWWRKALSLCPSNIRLANPAQVKLCGKGRKERICPLWPETAELLAALLKRQPRPEHEPLFVNRYGRPLGAAGVRFKLAQYVRAAAKELPSLQKKRVHPHTFRHTAGVQLVTAGVDVTVIRSWLGHVSLDTTNHYARANLETKRRALEQVDRATRPGRPPRWRRNPDLLNWLDSL